MQRLYLLLRQIDPIAFDLYFQHTILLELVSRWSKTDNHFAGVIPPKFHLNFDIFAPGNSVLPYLEIHSFFGFALLFVLVAPLPVVVVVVPLLVAPLPVAAFLDT